MTSTMLDAGSLDVRGRLMESFVWYYAIDAPDLTGEQVGCFCDWLTDPLNRAIYEGVCDVMAALDRMHRRTKLM